LRGFPRLVEGLGYTRLDLMRVLGKLAMWRFLKYLSRHPEKLKLRMFR
jgi:hypothetical protein